MAATNSAKNLTAEAGRLFDEHSNGLASAAHRAWRGGFGSGADWMRLAIQILHDEPLPTTRSNFQVMGLIKYGLASVAAISPVVLAVLTERLYLVLLAIPAFYAVEVQMVFLFPLALTGSEHPFGECRSWTIRAGGTIAAMFVVMPIAVRMLFGGFVGQGFVRSWCIGCLAICIWFERLHRASLGRAIPVAAPHAASTAEVR